MRFWRRKKVLPHYYVELQVVDAHLTYMGPVNLEELAYIAVYGGQEPGQWVDMLNTREGVRLQVRYQKVS